jgi:hypothetical protein
MELKAMLAHLVLEYDIKAEVEGVRPPDDVFGTRIAPSASGKVCFRKRQIQMDVQDRHPTIRLDLL